MATMPKRRLYARGRQFEYRVRNFLRALGWVVFRSAGSHTCVDLTALKPGYVLLVQCKASNLPNLGVIERDELASHRSILKVKVLVICRGANNALKFYVIRNDKLKRIRKPLWL